MRIAIFTDTYSPEINGVVTSIDTYRDELEQQGHEVWLYAPRYFGRESRSPRTIRVPSIPYPFKMMKERRLAWMPLREILAFRRREFDIIHSQVPGNMGVFALVVSAIWRVPHVHTYHTNYMEYIHYMPFPPAFSRRAIIWIARHFCGRCNHVISPSEGMRDQIRSYDVDAPISVIPTGIKFRDAKPGQTLADLFRQYSVPGYEIVSARRILVSVGRIGREKNHPFLIRAIRELKDRDVDAHLCLIGQGPDRPFLEKEIDRLGVAERVTLTGYMRREDVLAFVRECELFVFASKTETQGLALLEAMSVGTPVVAICATGISDLIGDGKGGIATEDSVAKFTDAIETLLGDTAHAGRLGEQALERAHEWSVERQAERLAEIYATAAAEFRAHGLPRYRHRERLAHR